MRTFIVAICLCMMSACATYDTASRFGGYTHNRIKENTYIITYKGNVLTPYKEAREMAIRRAKEIGKNLGYTQMYILGVTQNSESESISIRNGSYLIDMIGLQEPRYSIKVKYLFNHPKDKHLKEDVYKL